MKVLIGIVTHNRADIVIRAIESALNQDHPDTEIAVFDDGSTDGTNALRARFPQLSWHGVERPQGYLLARNQLMRETDADLYFSLDDDAFFMHRDEISRGVEVLKERTDVAALAYDVLSPDRPKPSKPATPFPTHMFIGCGHLLRVSAAREVEYYAANPSGYGSEEVDLCIRLLDRGHNILYLPGVHVWHEHSPVSRDRPAQVKSNLCNDLTFVYRRYPFPSVLWRFPQRVLIHAAYSLHAGSWKDCTAGFWLFFKSLLRIVPTRKPVKQDTYRKYLSLTKSYPDFFMRSHPLTDESRSA